VPALLLGLLPALALHVMIRIHKQGTHRGGAPTLPDVVHRYKSFTTSKYRTGVIRLNWHPFPGKLWQRNYYENIIRNTTEMNRIRQYIIDNPLHWENDENNPENII
jgi:putative transposase